MDMITTIRRWLRDWLDPDELPLTLEAWKQLNDWLLEQAVLHDRKAEQRDTELGQLKRGLHEPKLDDVKTRLEHRDAGEANRVAFGQSVNLNRTLRFALGDLIRGGKGAVSTVMPYVLEERRAVESLDSLWGICEHWSREAGFRLEADMATEE